MALEARGVGHAFDGTAVLADVDLTLHRGETLGLVGPSGCGKSTLVAVLGLLLAPQRGDVVLDGTPVQGVRHQVAAPLRTRVAVLFQSPRSATDPRLRLDQIIAEPLRATGRGDIADDWARDLAEQVGLTPDLLSRKPHAVSDGQLQRACLARALAQQPDYLLCDEATTMLDASTQAHLAAVIREYQAARRAGVLLVSHDRELLDRWADRQVLWTQGQPHPAH